MIQTLSKNWWLLAVCGLLYASMSIIFFEHAGNGFHSMRDVVLTGRIAVAAGACAVAAGLWNGGKGRSWLAVLNGVALVALGLILNGIIGPRIGLRTIALLVIVMAISIGILELIAGRTLRGLRRVTDGWFLTVAGVLSVAFAVPFLALGFHFIRLGPGSIAHIAWFASFYAFSAICLLGLGLCLRGLPGLSSNGLNEGMV
jgi:uncharacterized membrane protein HdeD (DUF308 family)